MSNQISLVRGTSKEFEIDLVDNNGTPVPVDQLVNAAAEFLLRENPDEVVDAIRFTTITNPTNLAFKPGEAKLVLTFGPSDTAALPIKLYFYQVQVTKANGDVLNVIPWSLFDLNLGGAATTPLPPFDNTVKINHDYQLPGDLMYVTPGGSPIDAVQIRLYYKSDYIAGNLNAPLGTTMSDAAGRWRDSILVPPGYSYIVRFEKPNEYGPDTQEIFA